MKWFNDHFYPCHATHFRKFYWKKKLTAVLIFKLLCVATKGFMKTFKAFIKPFQTSQRSATINITVNFLSPSGIGAGNVKSSLSKVFYKKNYSEKFCKNNRKISLMDFLLFLFSTTKKTWLFSPVSFS